MGMEKRGFDTFRELLSSHEQVTDILRGFGDAVLQSMFSVKASGERDTPTYTVVDRSEPTETDAA